MFAVVLVWQLVAGQHLSSSSRFRVRYCIACSIRCSKRSGNLLITSSPYAVSRGPCHPPSLNCVSTTLSSVLLNAFMRMRCWSWRFSSACTYSALAIACVQSNCSRFMLPI